MQAAAAAAAAVRPNQSAKDGKERLRELIEKNEDYKGVSEVRRDSTRSGESSRAWSLPTPECSVKPYAMPWSTCSTFKALVTRTSTPLMKAASRR